MPNKKINEFDTFTGATRGLTFVVVEDGVTKKGTYDEILSRATGGIRYTEYKAILNQTGTNDPEVVAILENTIGDIVWTRTNMGSYIGILEGAFTIGKTICPQFPAFAFEDAATFLPISVNGNPQTGWLSMYSQADNEIQIETYSMSNRAEWSTILGSTLLVHVIVYN